MLSLPIFWGPKVGLSLPILGRVEVGIRHPLFLKHHPDPPRDALKALMDLAIPDPQRPVALTGKPRVTHLITPTAMSVAIHLDQKPGLVGDKISKIRPHRRLPAKVERPEIRPPQQPPHGPLCRGGIAAKLPRTEYLGSGRHNWNIT